MYYRKLSTYLFILLALTLLISPQSSASNYSRQPQFNLYGSMGEAFTGQASLLYPFNNKEDSLFYSDLRGMFTSDEISEWNLGFGYRKKVQNRDFILGTYLFRDNRNHFNNDWNQWTLGGELLTKNMDFRFNYYLPDRDRVLASSINDDSVFVEGNLLVYQKADLNTYYEVMGGCDLEFGKRFTESDGLLNNLGAYFRVYNFAGDDTVTMSGTGVKIDKTFGDPNDVNYKLGIDWQDDNVRGTSTEAVFEISIPLGKAAEQENDKSKDELESRMTEGARRDIDIIIGQTKPERVVEPKENAQEEKEDNIFEQVGDVWYVTAEGDGDGTKNNPTNPIDLLSLEKYGANDVIVLLGNDGSFMLGPDTEYGNSLLQLQEGQKLLSPGGYLTVYSESDNSREEEFYPEGKTATVKYEFGSIIPASDRDLTPQIVREIGMVELANNTTVSGINFEMSELDEELIERDIPKPPAGIYGDSLSGRINITNNDFNNLIESIYIRDFAGNSQFKIDSNDFNEVMHGVIIDSTSYIGESTTLQNSVPALDISITANNMKDTIGNGIYTYINEYTITKLDINGNIINTSDLRELMIDLYGYVSPLPFEMWGNGIIANIRNSTINNPININANQIPHAYNNGISLNYSSHLNSNDINIKDNIIGKVGSPHLYRYIVFGTAVKEPYVINSNNGITVMFDDIYRMRALEENDIQKPNNLYIENNIIDNAYNDGISVFSNNNNSNIEIINNNIGKTRNNGISYTSNYYPIGPNILNNLGINNKANIYNNKINEALQYGIYINNQPDSIIEIIDNEIKIADQGGVFYNYYSWGEENITIDKNNFGDSISPVIIPYYNQYND